MKSKLKRLIKASEFNTMEKLALKIGVTTQAVHKWTKLGEKDAAGKDIGSMPAHGMIERLCQALKCSLGDLFELEVDIHPEVLTVTCDHLEAPWQIENVWGLEMTREEYDSASSIKRLSLSGSQHLDLDLVGFPSIRFAGALPEIEWEPTRFCLRFPQPVNLVIRSYEVKGFRDMSTQRETNALPCVDVFAQKRFESVAQEIERLRDLGRTTEYLAGVLSCESPFLNYGDFLKIAQTYDIHVKFAPGKMATDFYARNIDLSEKTIRA